MVGLGRSSSASTAETDTDCSTAHNASDRVPDSLPGQVKTGQSPVPDYCTSDDGGPRQRPIQSKMAGVAVGRSEGVPVDRNRGVQRGWRRLASSGEELADVC